MGKAKKGKKNFDSESENELKEENLNELDNINKKKKTKDEKKSKKKRIEEDNDLDEVVKGIEQDNRTSKTKGKTKKSKKQQLEDDEDEQLFDNQKTKLVANEDNEDLNNDDETKEQTGGKKSKKSKKKRKDSDDDLDKILAELQLEYSGEKKPDEPKLEQQKNEEETDAKKVKKEKKAKGSDGSKKEKIEMLVDDDIEIIDGDDDDDEEIGRTVKTAAQKKKEKKEREKAKKLQGKQKQQDNDNKKETVVEVKSKTDEEFEGSNKQKDKTETKDGSKKKKKEADKKEEKITGKGPGKKAIAAMQEALKKIKEEEERLKLEEEEQIKRDEEAEKARLEQIRLELERKEKKKQKEKERKERLKAEGKLLTAKQKADKARAQAMLDALRAQGVPVPEKVEKKVVRPGTRIRKIKKETSQEKSIDESIKSSESLEQKVEEEGKSENSEEKVKVEEDSEDDVKDAWDADSSDDDPVETKQMKTNNKKQTKNDESSSEEESDEESDSNDSSESESEGSSDEDTRHKDLAKRERAMERIAKRREEALRKKNLDDLRAAVVCVLGHVDTGKTKILDKLRRTNVQDGEAGGITQQIGATNVPIDNIKEQVKHVKGFSEFNYKLPGLLIIDTPGHESFSNLRNRGSSLCDIAILVVDIMHGLEPQTIESINLLKQKRTPFVVALNKIDRLYDWQTFARKDIRDILKAQAQHTQNEFDTRTREVILQFAEQGLNATLFWENKDPNEYVSLCPTSAITAEGMGNILALIVEMCQTQLAERLMYSEELQATVLEVKQIPGLGTTIDCILVNGLLREGETMVVAGTDGPIVTQIRSLLMPQPMKELRVKNAYIEYKEIKAAQGVKIAARDLEKTIAGLNLLVAHAPDEIDILKEEISKELRSALSSIKLQERGVFVQASTLGSLEALLDFLRSSKIPYANIRIGPVVKKDVMRASIMLEHDSQYATILAFDVKIERDAQELADSLGVKIFQADIIYHLFDKFIKYREELKQKKRDEFKSVAVFPCKLRVLPQYVFNSRDPIVCGVMVEAGIVKEGTPICVPTKDFVELGIVTSIENNHKAVDSARKGQEICIKIEPIPGESPKMFGRHFDHTDMLVSKITRQSIDACKDYFRDDLTKQDWQLMVELKKTFQIL